jgi:hypothetical protein
VWASHIQVYESSESRIVVRGDEILTAFLELEPVTQASEGNKSVTFALRRFTKMALTMSLGGRQNPGRV